VKYRVEVSRRAAKVVTGLEKPLRRRILAAIDGLADDPRPPGRRKLAGQEGWRIRVGDYRVIYEIHDQVLLVIVIDAGYWNGGLPVKSRTWARREQARRELSSVRPRVGSARGRPS
jgi:mRNA interferase RelE/StbE